MEQRNRVRLIAAGVVGHLLEWYDFAIYGYFAVSIGQNFFPQGDKVAEVLAAFGVFATGYVGRPLGGLVVGSIGDRYGKRTALSLSVIAMAVPTFLVGLLPGYQTLGVAAPVVLTLLCIVQGLSAGGECATSFTFTVETALPHRRGLTGACSTSAAACGMLLGSGAGAVMASLLPVDELHDWGWRVPFLLGLLVGVMGCVLRRHVQETNLPPHSGHEPVRETFRSHKTLLARITTLKAFSAVGYYLMFLYVVSWLQLVDGVAPERALDINTASMVAIVPIMLAAGWLSDRVGRKPLLTVAAAAGVLGAVPFLWLMHHADTRLVMLGQFGFVVIVGTAMAVTPSFLVESTPAAFRCTIISIGHNTGFGVMGGLSPLAATWLVQRTGMDLSPAYMIVAAAAATLLSLTTFRETAPARTGGP